MTVTNDTINALGDSMYDESEAMGVTMDAVTGTVNELENTFNAAVDSLTSKSAEQDSQIASLEAERVSITTGISDLQSATAATAMEIDNLDSSLVYFMESLSDPQTDAAEEMAGGGSLVKKINGNGNGESDGESGYYYYDYYLYHGDHYTLVLYVVAVVLFVTNVCTAVVCLSRSRNPSPGSRDKSHVYSQVAQSFTTEASDATTCKSNTI